MIFYCVLSDGNDKFFNLFHIEYNGIVLFIMDNHSQSHDLETFQYHQVQSGGQKVNVR